MKKVSFPVLKKTQQRFIRWQTEGRTAVVSLDSIFNDTTRKLFDNGLASLYMSDSVTWKINKLERDYITVCLDDEVYDMLDEFGFTCGDFKQAQLYELIAEFVEMSCQKAYDIISETKQRDDPASVFAFP